MVEGRIETRDVTLAAIGLLALGAVAFAGFVVSGVYNVSASRQHLDATTWILDVVRRQSVGVHSLGIDPPPLDDEGLVRLGAAHFEAGCAACHGAPGRPAAALAQAMLPTPPALSDTIEDWETRELFWIVHNGQKYTGMPAWIATAREDEVWAVVAFLDRLRGMEAAEYAALSGLEDVSDPLFGGHEADGAALLDNCSRCHGADGAAPVAGPVPVLRGQDPAYLARSLIEYREGLRSSGIMQLVATPLTDAEIAFLAAHYGEGDGPPPAVATTASLPRGGEIARSGVPERDVPACLGCHGADERRPGFPDLFGQPQGYLHQQLLLFREGVRNQTPHGALMTPVATRMSDADIAAVSAYFAAGTAP